MQLSTGDIETGIDYKAKGRLYYPNRNVND